MDKCAVVTLTIVGIFGFVQIHNQVDKDLLANNAMMQKEVAVLAKNAQEANLVAAANMEMEKLEIKKQALALYDEKKRLEAQGCKQ
jgi:glutamate mutase epsilon subunit